MIEPPAVPSSKPIRFGHYELLGRLGRGGMAEVFRARSVTGAHAGEIVALKRLLPELTSDPECVDLFTGEADLSRLLKHPNIVEVIEAGEVNDVWFLVLEYVEGRDLSEILTRCRKRHILLPVDFVIYMAQALLGALDFVHKAQGPTGKPLNIVHCDVSPSNVFISKLGEIKLGDFGVAKVRALDKWDEGELVWGKLSYLSPEQLSGRTYDRRADIWGAGSLIYEMLTNRKPFVAQNADELKTAIKSSRPHSITASRVVSVGLERVILKALEKDPDDRYQSAGDFSEALAPYFQRDIGTPLGIAAVVRGLFGIH